METLVDLFASAVGSHAAGDLPQAEDRLWAVLGKNPNHAEALRMLGVIARQKGDQRQAIDYFYRSLIIERSNPLTWKNLGDAHLAVGSYREAVAAFEQALLFQPDCADVYNSLGVALLHLGEEPQAIAVFEKGLRIRPDSPDIANNLGIIFHEKEQMERAADYFRSALRHQPDFPDASNSLAVVLKEQGRLEESRAQFLETLKLRPAHAQAHYQLSELAAEGRHHFSPEDVKRIKCYLSSDGLSPKERSLFCFTLGAICNKEGFFDDAFRYFQEANDIRHAMLKEQRKNFNPQKHQVLINHLLANENLAYFERVRGWGLDTELPIFIIGMPRSGSTLVEQILASHPQVFGAGELGEVPRIVTRLASEATSKFLLPTQEATQQRATELLDQFTKLANGAARLTTKTLDNYLHLGVIATLFPRARIIHCKREPLDVGLSCYFQNFQEIAFSFSLETIGAFYCMYEQMMSHWAQVLPMPIHEVGYEELVQNQEAVSRRLLAYCGLPWDDRCLDFHSNRRAVLTASSVQVRKPISTKSIGRWKNYHKHLEPLIKALAQRSATPSCPPAIPYSMQLES